MKDNFYHIQDVKLRNYNRVVVFQNLYEDFGAEAAREYVSRFTKQDRTLMTLLMMYIKKYGKANAVKYVTKDMEFSDTPEEEGINEAA